MNCDFFLSFKIPLANFNDYRKCLLIEKQKRLYSIKCPFCRMITFLDFEKWSLRERLFFKKTPTCCKITAANKGQKIEIWENRRKKK